MLVLLEDMPQCCASHLLLNRSDLWLPTTGGLVLGRPGMSLDNGHGDCT